MILDSCEIFNEGTIFPWHGFALSNNRLGTIIITFEFYLYVCTYMLVAIVND